MAVTTRVGTECALETTGTESDTNGPVSKLDRWLIRRLFQMAGQPLLEIKLWNGERFGPQANTAGNESTAGSRSASPELAGCLCINSRRALWSLLYEPVLQFGNAYCDGKIDVDGVLIEILNEINRALGRREQEEKASKLWTLAARLARSGSKSSDRDNIHHHYDIGNDFYRMWLDEQLVYTCAYFKTPTMSLEEAQTAKLDHVCRKLNLKPGDRVVEAGFGWGALALHMAREYGVTVKAYNVSHEQVLEARRRAREEGLVRQVEFIEDHWDSIRGEFDVFVSVGMLEHVRPENYRRLGEVIDGVLTESGRGLIHSIGINSPRRLNSWTERYIFPGAQPPSLSQMAEIFEPRNFSLLDVENLRLHYAETLRHWLDRFEQSTEKITSMFDERFVRMWRLYLAGSVSTFETGWLQLFQVLFAPGSSNSVPRTREYQYDNSESPLAMQWD